MSTASFDAPYGLVGAVGALSVIGTSAGCPYVAAVEEKTSRSTPAASIASSSRSVSTVLPVQYRSGRRTESSISERAARCTTPSKRCGPARTRAASAIVPRTNSAPRGTASANPLDRSSTTTTRCPSSSSRRATTLPM